MKVQHHIAVSVLISGTLFILFRSWGLSCASLVSGVLIDLDHVIDYWIMRGMRFDVQQIAAYFDESNFRNRTKIYFFFHSWEFLTAALATAFMTEWDPWATGLLVGYCHHMVLDEIRNNTTYRLRPYVLGYSLIWRWKNGFEFKGP